MRAQPSQRDGRSRALRLAEKGRKVFAPLDRRSDEQVRVLVEALPGVDQRRLVGAMQTIEEALEGRREAPRPYLLRAPRAGDFGWIVHRHGALYAQESGWDAIFEALVAEIVAKFVRRYEPKRERCWIAEREGEIVGCVFLVARSARVAQLRLLLAEPAARGLGIGSRLVAECVEFARAARYRRLALWTNSVLHSACHIYERAGFKRVKEEKHPSYGHDLVGQNGELAL